MVCGILAVNFVRIQIHMGDGPWASVRNYLDYINWGRRSILTVYGAMACAGILDYIKWRKRVDD